METLLLVLLALLGHPSYSVRERTSAHLERNLDSAIVLLKLGEQSSDKEVAHRCYLLHTKWLEKHADELVIDLRPKGWPIYPWDMTQDELGYWCHEYFNSEGYYIIPSRVSELRNAGISEEEAWSLSMKERLKNMIVARVSHEQYLNTAIQLHLDWYEENRVRMPKWMRALKKDY